MLSEGLKGEDSQSAAGCMLKGLVLIAAERLFRSEGGQDVDLAFPPGHRLSIAHDPGRQDHRIRGSSVRVKLDIADQLINGKIRPDGTVERQPIPHSGFAALDIVFSYFEMIAKYEAGHADVGASRKYFKEGVYSAFPPLKAAPTAIGSPGVLGYVRNVVDEVLGIMYEGVRCGLYHTGITRGRVLLTGEVDRPLAFDPQNGILIINPHLLVPALKQHLGDYVARIRTVSNQDLRRNFERRFDYDTRP